MNSKPLTSPTFSTQIRSFVYAGSVHRKFVKDFTEIALPLNDFVQKDKELDWLNPTIEAIDTLNTLKSKFVEAPLLALS